MRVTSTCVSCHSPFERELSGLIPLNAVTSRSDVRLTHCDNCKRTRAWRAGDRVEIHGNHGWDGHVGTVLGEQVLRGRTWLSLTVDGQDGVFSFTNDELTRI